MSIPGDDAFFSFTVSNKRQQYQKEAKRRKAREWRGLAETAAVMDDQHESCESVSDHPSPNTLPVVVIRLNDPRVVWMDGWT